MDRRRFLARSAAAAALVLPPLLRTDRRVERDADELFEVSLAQWSLHRTLRAGKLDNLDFPRHAKERFGIDAVEFVNSFFKDKAADEAYLGELKRRAADAGVKLLLIMCDGEGDLGDPDDTARRTAVENHHRWVEAATLLGCHSIRVNARSRGSPDEQAALCADGLARLARFAKPHGINVIVENHGGLSSDAGWLAGVIRSVGLDNCGTLPDFGNFHLGGGRWYDRYEGVKRLMPFAKAVSAKSHDFDEEGNETRTDYSRMMKIVLDAGYRGHVGIEYEGSRLPEAEGIVATRKLLERVRRKLSQRK